MSALNDVIENPLLRELHARQRAALVKRFPVLSSCSHGHFLSLWRYLGSTPQQFYSEPVYLEYLAWFKDRDRNNPTQLKAYISAHAAEIDRALLHLEEINGYDWHDSFQKFDDYELIRFIDQQVHPTYLRLVEAVFCPFLKIVAYFSRIDRKKGVDGLDVWSITQEVGRCLNDVIRPYRHIVRNGIAHGGITYLEKSIRYRDKKGNEENYGDSEVVRICDDLLDTCNALALALSVFSFTRQQDGYELPKQLLVEELRAETRTPWWEIVGCTPSRFSGMSQLIVYARPRTMDYGKVQISTFQSGILAEQFAPGFERYFFSIRSEKSWPGWAAFDGRKLRVLREGQESSLKDYGDILENNLVFYVPRLRFPAVIARLETLKFAFGVHVPHVMAELRNQRGLGEVNVRNAEIHRNSWGVVVNGSVYFSAPAGDFDADVIRKSCKLIVDKVLTAARRQASRWAIARHLPLGFARIAVFRKNYRKRRLSGFGLGEDLVCTVQVQRIGRIRSPDIFGSTIENYGKYRIAWNKAWRESTEVQQGLPADTLGGATES